MEKFRFKKINNALSVKSGRAIKEGGRLANRRMFSLDIVNSDAFLDMPVSAQNLYFHLAMRADDDGFVCNPNSIKRIASASDDDIQLLITRRFLISFDNGIVVIKHWKMQNTIKKDRYKPTVYVREYEKLAIKENGSYTEKNKLDSKTETSCIQTGSQTETQYRLGKNSIDYIPPISPQWDKPEPETDSFSKSFDDFWKAYPKRVSKSNALKAWNKLKPNDDLVREILSALEKQKQSSQWQKDNGRFISYPAKWLNERRWEDEDCVIEHNQPEKEYSFDLDEYKELVNDFGDEKSG